MTESNRYQRLLDKMLADIHGSDELRHFMRWRRVKGKALVAIEQNVSARPEVEDYLDCLGEDHEQRLLDYVLPVLNQNQMKRRVRFLKKMKKINERRVKNDLKGKWDLDPLFDHGWTNSIDKLIDFYGELDRLKRSSQPARFAKRTKEALDRYSLSDIVKIGKGEQRLYGNFSIFSRQLGVTASLHDYSAARTRNIRWNKWTKHATYGTFGIMMLALGALTTSVAMTYLNRRPDALTDEVQIYIQNDHLEESDLELRLEQTYGFDIVGEFTQEDLENLKSRLENSYPPEMIRLMGLRRIVIFDRSAQSQVDYGGRASRRLGEMRLFSGHINAIVDHEMAHFQTFTHQRTTSDLLGRWEDVSGPYDQVAYERGPPERGSARINTQYISGDDRRTPFHGYVRAYGGVNYQEDISTFVEAVRNQSLVFVQVTDNFHIYQQKLALLREYHYITHQEYTGAIDILRIARYGGVIESSSGDPLEVEQCVSSPEEL